MSKSDNGATVTVTSKGQATIPKEFRDKLRIDTPGRVRFIENEAGEVVIQPVERPSELRGSLADAETVDHEQTASEMLREERKRDDRRMDEKHGLDDE